MLYFLNDYSEGAHPRVMEALLSTNTESTVGYGKDEYCEKAADRLREVFACPEADVHFLVGGTQTNLGRRSSRPRAATSPCMRPARSRPPATRCSSCPGRRAGSRPRRSAAPWPSTGPAWRSTWSSRAWSTFPTRPSSARSTPAVSCRPCTTSAKSLTCSSISTGRAWPRRSRQRATT